MINFKFN